MPKIKNSFLNPTLFDDEYLVTSLRKKDLVKSLNLIKKDDTILDFGAGKCHYKKLLEEKCKKFIKVDFQTDDFNEIDFVTDKNGKIPVKNKSIDMVYSLQVLEHVENLDLYISEIERILKPEGIVWLSTHGMWPYHPTPQDYRRWTLFGLKNEFKNFKIIDEDYFFGTPAYSLMIISRIFNKIFKKINQYQIDFFNKFSQEKIWGKGNKNSRIKNRFLYIGNSLGFIVFPVLNILMFIAEFFTPKKFIKDEAVIYRLCLKKKN